VSHGTISGVIGSSTLSRPLSCHADADARQRIEAKGCELLSSTRVPIAIGDCSIFARYGLERQGLPIVRVDRRIDMTVCYADADAVVYSSLTGTSRPLPDGPIGAVV
jgi:hypothetical protein